jgi:hypothetical protein
MDWKELDKHSNWMVNKTLGGRREGAGWWLLFTSCWWWMPPPRGNCSGNIAVGDGGECGGVVGVVE